MTQFWQIRDTLFTKSLAMRGSFVCATCGEMMQPCQECGKWYCECTLPDEKREYFYDCSEDFVCQECQQKRKETEKVFDPCRQEERDDVPLREEGAEQ